MCQTNKCNFETENNKMLNRALSRSSKKMIRYEMSALSKCVVFLECLINKTSVDVWYKYRFFEDRELWNISEFAKHNPQQKKNTKSNYHRNESVNEHTARHQITLNENARNIPFGIWTKNTCCRVSGVDCYYNLTGYLLNISKWIKLCISNVMTVL